MKSVILLALILILFSCKKESSYSTKNYICNESNHSIKIIYYKNGLVQNGKTINFISQKMCDLVYESNGFGKGNGSNYLNGTIDMDSATIVFDKNIQAIHYGYNTVGLNPHATMWGNPRNIFGGSSTGGWMNRVVAETKHHIETELKYVFTEQDYLDAKNQ